MLGLITFCILFLFSAFAACGTARLVMMLIAPGELFGDWQRVLSRIEPMTGDRHFFIREFWYKRLGGCTICLRQFIAELSFVLLFLVSDSYGIFPAEHLRPFLLKWLVNSAVFVGYCGTVLQIGEWLECKNKRSHEPEENIIETIYQKN